MANTKARRHTHKYGRVNTPQGKVWRCFDPTCTHYIPAHQDWMTEGRATECWKCGGVTILDARAMKLDKPVCVDCDPSYVNIDDTDIDKINELFKSQGK